MDFNATIDLIIKDLNDASSIIDDLKRYPDVPVLQVELAKSKCRSAAEVIALLKSTTTPLSSASETITRNQPVQSQPAAQYTDKSAKVSRLKEVPQVEFLTAENSNAPVEKKPKPAEVKKPADTPIIADTFGTKTDLYDKQTASIKIEKDLSDRLKVKPISSLAEAIGISDKFLFIGEIFNGNKEKYAQAISRLDEVENIEDAKDIIMSYTGENSESEAVTHLLELVKLKLPSNE